MLNATRKIKVWWTELYWAIQHRFNPAHRYNKIDTKLPPGYYDPDTRLLHGVMSMVAEFYEATIESGNIACLDDHNSHIGEELKEIVDWWVNTYPTRDTHDVNGNKIPDRTDGNLITRYKIEQQWDYTEELMLIRVIKIRKYLWYP